MTPILAALLLAQAPAPQPACGPTAQIEAHFVNKYKEQLIGAGIMGEGVIYAYNNPKTGSFTIVLRRRDGTSCVMAAGTGWASMEPKRPGVSL